MRVFRVKLAQLLEDASADEHEDDEVLWALKLAVSVMENPELYGDQGEDGDDTNPS